MIIPSKWVILKWWSLWNDIWLSHRKERQRPHSFRNALWLSHRNDISKANCLLHACGVFRVFAYWILTKFNRQTPGWKNRLLSFRDDLWLSFRNERQRPQSFWNDISTVISKWPRKILVTRIIFVNKIDFGHRTAEMETQISVPAAFLFSSASGKKHVFLKRKWNFPKLYMWPWFQKTL